MLKSNGNRLFVIGFGDELLIRSIYLKHTLFQRSSNDVAIAHCSGKNEFLECHITFYGKVSHLESLGYSIKEQAKYNNNQRKMTLERDKKKIVYNRNKWNIDHPLQGGGWSPR